MTGLHQNHQKHLLTTFRSVDKMLADAVRALDGAQAQSPFSDVVADATPIQHKVTADYVAQLRAAMRRLMDANGIPLDRPTISAVWQARCLLMSVDVDIEELRPRAMRGYGDLTQDATDALNLIVTQLLDILDRMERYLAQGSGRDLRDRLARLEGTTDGAALLRALERVVTERGLVEFRSMLAMLIERLETNVLEVAIFGRVSSGKSSLLDYLLQTDVLPVGVTPVTAVPTRITYGPVPRATIWFAQEQAITVEPHRVAEFASERENPGNVKQVTRILVELPSSRLQEGVVFVDTPGLGSLAVAGAAEALAYLPRCDLGVVLTDATSALVPDDLSLLEALRQGGAQVMLLLSKADLLTPDEGRQAIAYAQTQVRANLGADVPTYLVSVKGDSSAWCDRWLAEALVPSLRQHQRLAQESVRRKIGDLRDRVLTVLRKRLERTASPTPAVPVERLEATSQALANALVRLDAARQEHLDWSGRVPGLVADILEGVAQRAADGWPTERRASQEVAPLFTPVAAEHVGKMVAGILPALTALRTLLDDALLQASLALGHIVPGDELPQPTGLPVFDPAARLPAVVVARPALAALGPGVLRHSIRRQLHGVVEAQLSEALTEYLGQLDPWRAGYLGDLRRAFTAQADACQAQLRGTAPGTPASPGHDAAVIRRDIAQLESFGPTAAAPTVAAPAGVRAAP